MAIYWTLGNFLKPLAIINLPKSPTFLGNFCKGVKIFFLMKSYLGNFYRHLAIFFWSHCSSLRGLIPCYEQNYGSSTNDPISVDWKDNYIHYAPPTLISAYLQWHIPRWKTKMPIHNTQQKPKIIKRLWRTTYMSTSLSPGFYLGSVPR